MGTDRTDHRTVTYRQRPAPTPDEEPFWRAEGGGHLEIQRCGQCRSWQHPPNPVCYRCLSRELDFERVSGLATVYSYTVNHQPWLPHLQEPYAVIVAELDEQPGLRFVSRLVDTPVEQVHIGLRVRVAFDPLGDELYAPLFTATGDAP